MTKSCGELFPKDEKMGFLKYLIWRHRFKKALKKRKLQKWPTWYLNKIEFSNHVMAKLDSLNNQKWALMSLNENQFKFLFKEEVNRNLINENNIWRIYTECYRPRRTWPNRKNK